MFPAGHPKSKFWQFREKILKITSNIFSRNTIFCLISRISQYCFVQDCLLRKVHLRRSLFFNKVASLYQPDTLLKKSPAQVFSCDFREIFKNIFLMELLRVTASKCHFQGSIQSSLRNFKKQDILTWFLLGLCFFSMVVF